MSKTFRRIICFAAAVIVIQSIALLFLTPGGIELLYPIHVRASAEKIRPDSNTYAVYYDMRQTASEADVIVVGIDSNVDTTYDMLGHFTRFVKQYNNISNVILDLNDTQATLVDFLFRQSKEIKFNAFLERLENGTGMSKSCCGYLSELFFVNSTMSPQKKFSVISYNESNTPDVFGETEKPEDTRTLTEKIRDIVLKCPRSVICAVDSRELEYGSSFRDELDSMLVGKKIVYVQTHYTKSCVSGETHTVYAFPFEPENAQVYFVNNSDFDGFYSYYSFVTELFGSNKTLENKLNTRSSDYFFVITGGRSVDNEADENNENLSEELW
ncbi:MAG: hypothetical protein ACI4XJ_04740 [Eubacteriales bacterium]